MIQETNCSPLLMIMLIYASFITSLTPNSHHAFRVNSRREIVLSSIDKNYSHTQFTPDSHQIEKSSYVTIKIRAKAHKN